MDALDINQILYSCFPYTPACLLGYLPSWLDSELLESKGVCFVLLCILHNDLHLANSEKIPQDWAELDWFGLNWVGLGWVGLH